MKSLFLTQRFFYLFSLVAIFFAVTYAFPLALPIGIGLFGLAVALVLIDIALLYGRPLSFETARIVPPVLSLGDANTVKLKLRNLTPRKLTMTIVDELPVQLQRRDFSMFTDIEPQEDLRLEYKILPVTRGVYNFGKLYGFCSSALRLIERRIVLAPEENIAVYPSIIQMKQYELRASFHLAQEIGIKKLRRIGHSYEFEQIKNYVEGDDYRSINWKASGRKGALMVNQYEDERSQQVYCVIDKSRVMHMPFHELSLLDYAINATLALSNIILKKGDKAGLLSFSDILGSTIRADRAGAQLGKIQESLYRESVRPVEVNYELLYQASRRLISGRSLFLLFTNFESRYALERALPILRKLNKFHLLVVIFFENTEISDMMQEETTTLSQVYKQTVARQFIEDKKEMVRTLKQFGIQSVLTKPADLTLHTINKYLELKSRGLI